MEIKKMKWQKVKWKMKEIMEAQHLNKYQNETGKTEMRRLAIIREKNPRTEEQFSILGEFQS